MQRNYLTGPHEGGELKDGPKGGLEADGKTKAGQDWAEVTVQSSWGQGGILTWNCTTLKIISQQLKKPSKYAREILA